MGICYSLCDCEEGMKDFAIAFAVIVCGLLISASNSCRRATTALAIAEQIAKHRRIIHREQPAPAVTTTTSTSDEQASVSTLAVPSFIEPPAIELPAEAAQVSVVSPASTTCQPAAITHPNHRTQPASVPRQYVQQTRRGLFNGRFRR